MQDLVDKTKKLWELIFTQNLLPHTQYKTLYNLHKEL